jgi:hypothetical protein
VEAARSALPAVRTVAIHQPNYIPWPGYFHKLSACDVFVYLDAVQFPRGQSFAARNRVKTPNGVAFLTIPVSLPRGREGMVSYREVQFADSDWKRKHLRTIEQSYRRASAFDEIWPLYRDELEPDRGFVELNVALIEAVCAYLGIDTPRVRLSDLLPEFGAKSELILDICRALGATTYLSGSGGGRRYTDEAFLARHGIEVRYDEYPTPTYPQLWGPFVPGLSVVDVLFNCGSASRRVVQDARDLSDPA